MIFRCANGGKNSGFSWLLLSLTCDLWRWDYVLNEDWFPQLTWHAAQMFGVNKIDWLFPWICFDSVCDAIANYHTVHILFCQMHGRDRQRESLRKRQLISNVGTMCLCFLVNIVEAHNVDVASVSFAPSSRLTRCIDALSLSLSPSLALSFPAHLHFYRTYK